MTYENVPTKPAVNFSTLPCLVSLGVINVNLGGVKGTLLSCGGKLVVAVDVGVTAVGCG